MWHRRWHYLHNLLHLLLDGVLIFSTEYILLTIHFMHFVYKGLVIFVTALTGIFFNLCVVKCQFYYLFVNSFNHVLLIFSFQRVISKNNNKNPWCASSPPNLTHILHEQTAAGRRKTLSICPFLSNNKSYSRHRYVIGRWWNETNSTDQTTFWHKSAHCWQI